MEKRERTWNSNLGFEVFADRPKVPAELLEFLKSGQPKNRTPDPLTPILTQGNRDEYLFHAALQLFKDGRNYQEVEQIILNMAKVCNPPFPEREALAKIKSAYSRFSRQKTKLEDQWLNRPEIPVPAKELKTNIRCYKDIPKIPIEWLWPGRIPLAMLSLIAGQQGSGKSTFSTWMAARLSRGDPWPDGPGYGYPVDTLLITSEDPAEQVIKYRIEAAGGDDDHIFQLDAILDKDEEFPFDFNKHLPMLEEELRKNPLFKFIIIDPLASHMGGQLDANDMNRVRWSLSGLARCSKKFNVGITGIAHFKKQEDVEDVLNKIAGSYQFSSLPRTVWMIMADKNDEGELKRKYFLPGKTNPCQPRPGFSFYIQTVLIDGQETGKIVIEAEKSKYSTADELHTKNRDMRQSKEKSIEKIILDYLEYGPRPSSEIDEVLKENGYSPRTADRVKSALKDAGRLKFAKDDTERFGCWYMFLPSVPGKFAK